MTPQNDGYGLLAGFVVVGLVCLIGMSLSLLLLWGVVVALLPGG